MLMADIIWGKSNFIKKCIMMYKNTALSKTGLYFYLSREDSHLFQVVSNSKFVSVGVQSPTEINAREDAQ